MSAPGVPLQPAIRLNRRKMDASGSVVSYAERHRIWARERKKKKKKKKKKKREKKRETKNQLPEQTRKKSSEETAHSP